MFYPCPACGTPNSATQTGLCGPCEGKRLAEREQERKDALAEVEAEMAKLKTEHSDGCDCSHCMRVHIYYLQLMGKHQEAEALYNA